MRSQRRDDLQSDCLATYRGDMRFRVQDLGFGVKYKYIGVWGCGFRLCGRTFNNEGICVAPKGI